MKVDNTNWYWFSREKDIEHAFRKLDKDLTMNITERFGEYRLHIGHSFKTLGNTYYNLRSKDMESACHESDDIAREEFTRFIRWNEELIEKLGDN